MNEVMSTHISGFNKEKDLSVLHIAPLRQRLMTSSQNPLRNIDNLWDRPEGNGLNRLLRPRIMKVPQTHFLIE